MEHSTEVLYNRTMVYCTPEHRFGSDALLLARFSQPRAHDGIAGIAGLPLRQGRRRIAQAAADPDRVTLARTRATQGRARRDQAARLRRARRCDGPLLRQAGRDRARPARRRRP